MKASIKHKKKEKRKTETKSVLCDLKMPSLKKSSKQSSSLRQTLGFENVCVLKL